MLLTEKIGDMDYSLDPKMGSSIYHVTNVLLALDKHMISRNTSMSPHVKHVTGYAGSPALAYLHYIYHLTDILQHCMNWLQHNIPENVQLGEIGDGNVVPVPVLIPVPILK